MRVKRAWSLLALAAIVLASGSLTLTAKDTAVPTGKKQIITVPSQTRVGDALLEPGDYQIQHMGGTDNHFMVFTAMTGGRGAVAPRPGREVARVKCALEASDKKTENTEVTLGVNATGEAVIKKISIKGEKGGHLF
ncbi:MAG: hypothetical protein HYX74_06805 [Acidobacteria bacterium]|nr:hypothetical protein [Acidobacteriota bacterium]